MNKQNCHFLKMKDRKVKQFLSGVGSGESREDVRKACRR
jgi:hypothetical protein